MAFVVELTARQNPFPYLVDESDRTYWSCNYRVYHRGSTTPDEILATFIASGALGTRGSTLFLGPRAVIPDGSGIYTQIIDTGGYSPTETQNGDVTRNSTVQVIVRSQQYEVGRTRANAIRDLLDGIRNTTL